jgi:hypothetical protein
MIAVGRGDVRGEGVLRSFEKLSGYVWTFILFLIFHLLISRFSGNPISAASCAFLVNCIVAHEELKKFDIDCKAFAFSPRLTFLTPILLPGEPAEASSCREWVQLRLPRVDPAVLRGGWADTLSYVREFLRGDNVPVFDMRLMVVGASMVSLIV